MTNGDNPGGDDPGDGGNRTVFRPSPLSGMGAQPRPAPPPTRDAEADPPQPSAASRDASPSAARPRLGDDGIPPPALEREVRSPLVDAAGPLLALAASVRSGRARIGMAEFHREAVRSLGEYQAAIAPQYAEDTRRSAYFMLAATVDDIARNLPSLDGAGTWEGSLLTEVAAGGWSEDELWDELDAVAAKPEDNADLIELAHACLAAGFQGRYRGQPGGGDEIEKRDEKLFKALEHPRGMSHRFVSPQWVGFNAPLQKVPAVGIITLAVVGALVLILLAYFGLRMAAADDVTPPGVATAAEGGA